MKDYTVHIRVTAEQKAVLVAAAEKAGVSLSAWLLMLALKEAKK